ncbi:hypothetical protein APR11_002548 [Nocardia amikacinitolerans]|nr:hypothetical protein [Nocardia amikacinitolerans]MCP2296120.1 hypothetical protein [Nocardia amikacinitolerans]
MFLRNQSLCRAYGRYLALVQNLTVKRQLFQTAESPGAADPPTTVLTRA